MAPVCPSILKFNHAITFTTVMLTQRSFQKPIHSSLVLILNRYQVVHKHIFQILMAIYLNKLPGKRKKRNSHARRYLHFYDLLKKSEEEDVQRYTYLKWGGKCPFVQDKNAIKITLLLTVNAKERRGKLKYIKIKLTVFSCFYEIYDSTFFTRFSHKV